MGSPTERTLKYLRHRSWDAAVVERYLTIPGRSHGVRQDAFGFIDILAFRDMDVAAVQATSTGNMGARIKKILASPIAERWIRAWPDRVIFVIGWKRYAKPVDRKWWRPTVHQLMPGDFDESPRGKLTSKSAKMSRV